MKKIISLTIIIFLLFGLVKIDTYAYDKNSYFVVTAYYSPLPDQNYYLTGNYESEKRLNGQGIRGASGKPVFSGMLAAPKNYKFGTKIKLNGLGIGEVADRGGAIVNAGNRGYSYDRIDVWVGYGDEGLRRALYWGKRTIKGEIISSISDVDLNYKSISAPLWATKGLKKISNIFNIGIGIKSDKDSIIKLQKFLTEVGLYNSEINGIYNNEIIDIIYDFQIKNGLIKQGTVYGAGYWGNNTRALFLKKYLNGEFDISEDIIIDNTKNKTLESNNNLEIFNNIVDTEDKIRQLEKILIELELYTGEISGIYKNIIDSIYNYQLSKGIVNSIYTPGAGNFGPKTRESLKNTYIKYLEKKEKIKLEEVQKAEELKKQIEIEEKRKNELEQKYKNLEKLSNKKADEKLELIGNPKFGEISHGVRELQITLKELGYFEYKDTAIYGNITKESIIAYQIDNNIISSNLDIGAGIVGPKTKSSLKNNLINRFLQELVKTEDININELAIINNSI